MGCTTSLVGKTQKETVLQELEWVSHWASSLMRHLTMAHKTMSMCASMGGANYDYGEMGPQPATLDSISAMLHGTIQEIDSLFEMQYMMGPNGLPIWKALQDKFIELDKQAKGLIPIPVEGTVHEPTPKKEPTNLDKDLLKKHLLEIIELRDRLQKLLKKYYDATDANFPFVQLQIKVVNNRGEDVHLPVLDIEKIIDEEVEKRMRAKVDATPAVPQGPATSPNKE